MTACSNCKTHAKEIEDKVHLNIMAVLCVKKLNWPVFLFIYAIIPSTQSHVP